MARQLRVEESRRNQLSHIYQASGGVFVSYQYDLAGNRLRRTIYYGAYTDYHYDAINRLDTQTSYFNGSTARFDYGFDKVNRIKYEQRNLGAADGFAYDPRNELTGFNQNGTLNANGTVSAAYNVSITYDANGNRVERFGLGSRLNIRSGVGSRLNI
jgi:YD repeat-containing protein